MSDKEERYEKYTKEMFENFYGKVEGRIKELSDQVKDNILPKTEETLKKNIFKTVLISFGAGFIIGILVVVFGFRRGKKK
jgi:hypothetical protein